MKQTLGLIVALALVGCGAPTPTTAPPSAVIVTTAAPTTAPSLMTIAITDCASGNARGTVKNGSTETVDIYITVHFIQISGVLLDDGIDVMSGVRPGETASWDVPYLGSRTFATCRAEVRSASPTP
jgi:uncharacterized protein YcfL